MPFVLALAAVLAASLGALVLYLGAPHQKLRRKPIPRNRSLAAGTALVALALLLFLRVAGPATAVFILLTLLMALWSVPPLAVAYVHARTRTGDRR